MAVPAYDIILLSGSTDGRGIKVSATTSGGANTIHTAVTGTTDLDLIDIMAINSDTQGRTLTLMNGGTTNPDDYIVTPIPNVSGLVVVCERLPLRNGLLLKAFADVTNIITLFGRVIRIDK